MPFFVFFLGVFIIFPSVFSCNCLSIISNKNPTFNPTISTPSLYSAPKTRHIVIYVTKIKHWIEISGFSKLEFRGNKFRGWPKNFRNSWNEISRLAKNFDIRGNQIPQFGEKPRNREIFFPRKFLTLKYVNILLTLVDILVAETLKTMTSFD